MRAILILIDHKDRTNDVIIENGGLQTNRTSSDPIAKTTFVMRDKDAISTLQEMQEVVILDENIAPNPALNIIVDPNITNIANYTKTNLSGCTITTGATTVMTPSNASVGTASIAQVSKPGLAIVGQTYYYSMQINVTSALTNAVAFLRLEFLNRSNVVIGSATEAHYTSGNVRQSINAVAPALTRYVRSTFGVITSNATNSGSVSFSNAQTEPAYFTAQSQPYPSPVVQTSPTAYTLPPQTTIRQQRIFAGLITRLENGEYLAGQREVKIEVSSPSILFETTGVNVSFSNELDLDVIDEMLLQYFPGLIQRKSNGIPGVTIPQLIIEGTARDVMNQLCANSGYIWYIDENYELHYKWPGYASSYPNLSDSPDNVTTVPYYNYNQVIDGTQIGNQIIVTGGYFGQSTPSETFTGDGTTTRFTVTQKIYSVSSVTVNGAAQTVVVSGSTSAHNCDYSVGGQDINFTTASKPAAGATIVVTYLVQATAKARCTDWQSVANYTTTTHSGKFTRYINDSSLISLTGAAQRGIIELIQYNYGLVTITLSTQTKFDPADMVALTNAGDGYNQQTFLVQQVTSTYLGVDEFQNDVWEYNLTIGAYYRFLSNLMNHIHRQVQQSTSQPAAPILQENAVIIESMLMRDDGLTGH